MTDQLLNLFQKDLLAFLENSHRLTVQTEGCEQTEAFGAALALLFAQHPDALPPYIALRGDLGVGKTAFVRGFTRILAPGCAVRSPTFALVNEYRARNQKTAVFHFDMYRITDEDDLYSIGYDDYLERGICLVEWSENIPYALPDERLSLTIEICSSDLPDHRKITLEFISQTNG
jgi:tRNA threonylcarbamoyladenosine biosynthesis protein TsaE